jgi:glutaminase
MSITRFDDTTYSIGNSETKFSIQSISKVFTFTKSLKIHGAAPYKRVGKEPFGNPFNSLIQFEYERRENLKILL